MPSKEFLKGKQQITLYPTVKQFEQLKEKMKDNGYSIMSKYLIDVGLKAEIKIKIENP